MEADDLNPAEWQCLLRCARGQPVADAGLATLAQLERLNLLMRARDRRYVVTALGQRLLATASAAA